MTGRKTQNGLSPNGSLKTKLLHRLRKLLNRQPRKDLASVPAMQECRRKPCLVAKVSGAVEH
ncbi:MAG: hypothetical protein GY948_11535 [Alphaproteobacteria bacterium]|nr:hypothetical protein [Alphaproteobacteria bacterium]